MKPAAPSTTSTALVLSVPDRIKRLDELAVQHAGAAALVAHDAPITNALALAVAMKEIRDLMTPEVMGPIMALMNSPLGFKTDRPNDKQREPYNAEEVRDCAIEAMLRGFRFVGNEWNILQGNFYAAKEGLRRKVLEHVTDLEVDSSIPKLKPGPAAEVTSWANYRTKEGGETKRFERTREIRGNGISTADTYIGKAERKLLADLLKKLTGGTHPDGDAGDNMPAARAHVVDEERGAGLQGSRTGAKRAGDTTAPKKKEGDPGFDPRADAIDALNQWLAAYKIDEPVFLSEAAAAGHNLGDEQRRFGDCSTEQLIKLGKAAEALCKIIAKNTPAA